MKIQIKDLLPNPFRNMKNYPIDSRKIKSLTNSIKETGFWDNILVRRNNGKIEIAYGHHRLIVLKKIFKPDNCVDIPLKKLDDETMIKIMANENNESWGTGPKIIDETIGEVNKFLDNHPEMKNTYSNGYRYDAKHPHTTKEVYRLARFLGKNWSINRIALSLERIRAEATEEKYEKHIDKEAVEMLPTESSAVRFVKATKQIEDVTPEQQKEAAKKIIEEQDFSESGIKSALLEEKYKDMEPEKSEREKEIIKARDFVHGIAKDLAKVNEKIVELIKRKDEPNFDVYEHCIEAEEFTCEVKILISNLKKLGGRKWKLKYT